MPDPGESPSTVTGLALRMESLEQHRPRLLAALRRRIDPGLAARIDPEAVLNDAFLDAARRWEGVRNRPGLSVYAWLYRIARDRLIEAWRRETRGRRDVRRDLPWPERSSAAFGLDLMNPGTRPSEAAVRGEVRDRMTRALGLLKDGDRDVLWMRNAEQLSFGEIGQVLGVTENAATVRYVRALKRLKDCWRALYGEGEG